MPSLGELFVELGVVGDVKPLEKAIGTMKEAVKQIDNEIKANQRLLKYLQDIKNARTAGEKATIKENFTKEIQKQKMLDEIDANQKAVDGKKALASNIAGVVKGVGAFVGALTGAAIAMNKFTNDLVQSNQAMLDLTRTTDIALGTFQKWGSIGKMLGVNNVDQQLEGLNQKMFDLMLTGEGARGFQLAGINPIGQDAEGVLEQLRNRISGMNDTTATYLLQQMGLDPRMLHLLRMSRTEFEELGQTIRKYQLSPDQTRQIQAMNIQLQIAGIKLKYLKDRAILALMPAWTQFMASLTRVAEGVAKFVKWLAAAETTGAKVTKIILGIATAVGVLRTALMLLNLNPIIAGLSLLAGALYLIADDIMAYMNGGGSIIGVIAKGLQDLDLKGFIDFPVPKWLEYLIQVIDWLSGHKSDRVAAKIMDEAAKKIDTNAVKIKDTDGSFGYAEITPGYEDKHKIITGGAAPIDYTVKVELPNWVQNMLTGAATGSKGYEGTLPNLSSHFISPAAERTMSSNTTNTDNRQINQTISIQSNQPVMDIQNQLTYARNAIAAGWA